MHHMLAAYLGVGGSLGMYFIAYYKILIKMLLETGCESYPHLDPRRLVTVFIAEVCLGERGDCASGTHALLIMARDSVERAGDIQGCCEFI